MSELWLKNEKVLTFGDEGLTPVKILKIHNPELLPIRLRKKCTMENIITWLNSRKIPDNRDGIVDLKSKLGDMWLKSKNCASLSDQYWIKWRDEKWSNVNFFTNKYSMDVGNLMFYPWKVNARKIDTASPDLTTNGLLKKRWIQKENKVSYLVKAGCRQLHQEPLNEVLVSVLLEQLKIIPFVRYDLYVEGVAMCSISKNVINQNTMLIPAGDIFYSEPKKENDSTYVHLFKMCEKYEIPNYQDFINGMIFIDRLTGNEDRNLGNIAFIYNVEQKKFEGPAPLFDSGNAYWNIEKIFGNQPSSSKMFGDVERKVFDKIKKKCDIGQIFSKDGYEMFRKTIMSYPCYSDIHKENLLKAIKKRNEVLCSDNLVSSVKYIY